MKISICVTVKNEEKNIVDLLTSLISQTKKADEIIIVDGGSSDKTLEIVKHFAKKDRSIKILDASNSSTAKGRNLGIEVSKGDVIATTDSGCIPYSAWLEKITQPFIHEKIGIVAGFYNMPYQNSFQEALRVYLGTVPERFDSLNFIPSTRSVAFRKSVWEGLGGFNEKLKNTGEDTEFFYKAVKNKVKITRVEEAIVEWEEIKEMDFKKASNKFLNYAKGDAKSKIWWHPSKHFMSHNIKIIFIYLRYLVGLFLLIKSFFSPPLFIFLILLILLYLFWPVWKWRDVVKKREARFWLPVIQIVSDIQVMRGFAEGTISKQ